MRVTTEVTAEDCLPSSDLVDPTAPGYGAHLEFHAILRRCGQAWTSYLQQVHGMDTGVIVPNVDASYHAEVGVGLLDIDVAVTRIGTTSFTVRCRVEQDGQRVATVDVVLVRFDYAARQPTRLTAGQRASLERELEAD